MIIPEESRHRAGLNDLAVDLAAQPAGLRRSLPAGVLSALAGLVRAVNCYYSNLIEGHDTHPIDIERALNNDYSTDPRKRDLQLEARAHIAVQRWIDDGGLKKGRAATREAVCEMHQRFCGWLSRGPGVLLDAGSLPLSERPDAAKTCRPWRSRTIARPFASAVGEAR